MVTLSVEHDNEGNAVRLTKVDLLASSRERDDAPDDEENREFDSTDGFLQQLKQELNIEDDHQLIRFEMLDGQVFTGSLIDLKKHIDQLQSDYGAPLKFAVQPGEAGGTRITISKIYASGEREVAFQAECFQPQPKRVNEDEQERWQTTLTVEAIQAFAGDRRHFLVTGVDGKSSFAFLQQEEVDTFIDKIVDKLGDPNRETSDETGQREYLSIEFAVSEKKLLLRNRYDNKGKTITLEILAEETLKKRQDEVLAQLENEELDEYMTSILRQRIARAFPNEGNQLHQLSVGVELVQQQYNVMNLYSSRTDNFQTLQEYWDVPILDGDEEDKRFIYLDLALTQQAEETLKLVVEEMFEEAADEFIKYPLNTVETENVTKILGPNGLRRIFSRNTLEQDKAVRQVQRVLSVILEVADEDDWMEDLQAFIHFQQANGRRHRTAQQLRGQILDADVRNKLLLSSQEINIELEERLIAAATSILSQRLETIQKQIEAVEHIEGLELDLLNEKEEEDSPEEDDLNIVIQKAFQIVQRYRVANKNEKKEIFQELRQFVADHLDTFSSSSEWNALFDSDDTTEMKITRSIARIFSEHDAAES